MEGVLTSLFADPLEPTAPETEDDRLIVLLDEYAGVSSRLDELKERAEYLRATIAAHMPEDPGSHTRILSGRGRRVALTVKRNETFAWETDCLATAIGVPAAPHPVKMKLSIGKADFEGLDDDYRKQVLPALTRKAGAPNITTHEVKD